MGFFNLEELIRDYKAKVAARVEDLKELERQDFHTKVRRLVVHELQKRPSHSVARDLRSLVELLELGIF